MTHDLSHRLTEHNTGMNRSTAPYMPWEIVHFEKFETRALAHQKELKLKTSSGRRFIRKNGSTTILMGRVEVLHEKIKLHF